MSHQAVLGARNLRFALLFLLSLAAAACSVSLISGYDEVFDRSASDTQKKITLLLTHLQNPAARERRYSNSAASYAEIGADLHALRVRADANNIGGNNSETITILDTIENNLVLLEDAHKQQPSGLSLDFVRLAQRTIDLQFVALIQLERAKQRGP